VRTRGHAWFTPAPYRYAEVAGDIPALRWAGRARDGDLIPQLPPFLLFGVGQPSLLDGRMKACAGKNMAH